MLSPHHCQGQICSYVLKLQGDEEADFYVYCGYTKDIEKRMLAHTGIREAEQAAFCKLHPPDAAPECLPAFKRSGGRVGRVCQLQPLGGDPQGPRPRAWWTYQYVWEDALPSPGLAASGEEYSYKRK